MTTFYKSHGRELTPNNLNDALKSKLVADGWSLDKPEEAEEVPTFTEMEDESDES